jgi:hypothetical protein
MPPDPFAEIQIGRQAAIELHLLAAHLAPPLRRPSEFGLRSTAEGQSAGEHRAD